MDDLERLIDEIGGFKEKEILNTEFLDWIRLNCEKIILLQILKPLILIISQTNGFFFWVYLLLCTLINYNPK